MHCTVCGNETRTDASFCPHCGAKLRDVREACTPDDAVYDVVTQRLDGIKNRNPSTIRRIFVDDYTKFDDWPPFTRQDVEEALHNEVNAYPGLTNYAYEIRDHRIAVFGGAALATFHLRYTGGLRGKRFAITSRVTVVMRREMGGWKVVHEHYSRFPHRRR